MVSINKTTDYSQFKHVVNNRDVGNNPVTLSIQKKDMLESHPILVDSDMNIIDGQHRLAAAKFLQLPIYYIINDKIRIEDIPLCQVQRPWETRDFLKFFKDQKEDYRFIHEMHEKFKLPLHFLIKTSVGRKDAYRCFRSGNYAIVKEKKDLMKDFELLKQLYDLCKEIICKNITIDGLRALWSVVSDKDYDHKQMMKRCDKQRDGIIDAFKLKEQKHITERLKKKVYNFRSKNCRMEA